MVSTIAALALTFGLAHSAVLPPAPPSQHGKDAAKPPPPPGPKDGSKPPGPKDPKGPLDGPPPPPPGPPGSYQTISGTSVVVVTPSASSNIESSATSTSTGVTSANATLTTGPSTNSACPTDLFTTTTETHSEPETIYDYVTVTESPYTTTVHGYSTVSTFTSTLDEPSTEYSYVYTSTETGYYQDTFPSVGVCTSTSTVTTASTSTVYTGSYTPTSLPTYCHTTLNYVDVYPAGSVTETVTQTEYPRITETSYQPWTYTEYAHDATTTVTVTTNDYAQYETTSTETIGLDCTATAYSTTVTGTTATQSAKCAPTNLITNIGSSGNADALDSTRYYHNETSTLDASHCCQACLDSECVAMDFAPGFGCTLYHNSGEDCGKSIQVETGWTFGPGFTAQSGCGSVQLAPEYY